MKPDDAERKRRIYSVPRRFGLATILIVTAVFAVLFSLLRLFNAPPAVYIFLMVFTVIGGAQMIFGKTPRTASAVTGGVLYVVAFIVDMTIWGDVRFAETLFLGLSCGTVFGALLGYAAGVLIAGVFLVIDKCETWISRKKTPRARRDDGVDENG